MWRHRHDDDLALSGFADESQRELDTVSVGVIHDELAIAPDAQRFWVERDALVLLWNLLDAHGYSHGPTPFRRRDAWSPATLTRCSVVACCRPEELAVGMTIASIY
jgi:hypothetical protein